MTLQYHPLKQLAKHLEDMDMRFLNDLRVLDFEPFNGKNSAFPPYDVYEVPAEDSEQEFNKYIIDVALAGYSVDDISVVMENSRVKISSEKSSSDAENINYAHKGIAKRAFDMQFRVPEHAEITDCVFEDGILRVEITRNVPKEKLPKRIEVKRAS